VTKEDRAGMQDLTLVGRSEDGSQLILQTEAGVRFAVPIDDSLLEAVSGSSAGDPEPVRLEMRMDTPLRPRDIQARIRAGESPESVAAAAGTDVDRVMTFAMPVLAERAHIAERAQRASVRGRHTDTGTILLGDAVSERLRRANTSPETVNWDAWRREDGRWALIAIYTLSGATALDVVEDIAEFVFDTAGRYVLAENDAARWLTGDEATPEAANPPGAAETSDPILSVVEAAVPHHETPLPSVEPTEPRRLASVATEDELPLGDDVIGMVSSAPRPSAADWIATQASDRPADNEPTIAVPETAPGPESEAAPTEAQTAEAPRKTKRRSSVPSWDEIMFGSGPNE
jgi:hypothetical protein